MRGVLAVLVLVACDRTPPTDSTDHTGPTDGTGDTGDTTLPTTDPTVCVSGEYWTGGDEESPLMHPGRDCIACHTDRHEGPDLVVAGTVYTRLHEPDDCNGRSGVVVEITGDDGHVFTASTNPAGNFFLYTMGTALVTPYTARVLVNGVAVSAMATPQTSGACGSCHTVDGTSDAPGRIVVPE